MRELKTSDIGVASKIVKKIGIKLEGASQEEVGMSLVQGVMENYHQAEDEVALFMSGLIGITKEEWLDLPLEETIKYFMELKEQKGLTSFFKLLKMTG